MSIENFRKKMKLGNSRLWGIKIDWTQRMKRTNQAQATPRRMEKGGSCTVIEILSTILHLDPIYVYRKTLSCSIATCLLLELNLGSLKPDPVSYPKNHLAWSSKVCSCRIVQQIDYNALITWRSTKMGSFQKA